jgi:hypothetical protein
MPTCTGLGINQGGIISNLPQVRQSISAQVESEKKKMSKPYCFCPTPRLRPLSANSTGCAITAHLFFNQYIWKPNQRRNQMIAAKVLTEDKVNIAKIKEIIESAFLKATLDNDGDLIVHTDNGPRVIISVDEDRKLIRFLLIYDNESGWFKAEHTNRMNDSYIFARFSVPDQGDRVDIDYFLPFEGGVIAYQLISALRIFARVAPAAIHEEASREEASRYNAPTHLLQ